MNWDAIAAIATFAAVLVALVPIWLEAIRNRARARNLRLRLGAKLVLLRPTLMAVARGTNMIGTLLPDEFHAVIHDLESMQSEAAVLSPKEQDRLGATMLNLVLAAPLFARADLTSCTADTVLNAVDATTQMFEHYGLMNCYDAALEISDKSDSK